MSASVVILRVRPASALTWPPLMSPAERPVFQPVPRASAHASHWLGGVTGLGGAL